MSFSITLFVLLAIAFFIGIRQLATGRRASVPRRGSWRRWVVVAGLGLLVLPGLITVGHALFANTAGDIFEGAEIMVPKGLSVGVENADLFLVRTLVTVDGAEDFPVDYEQAVIELGGNEAFTLRDGRDLTIHLVRLRAQSREAPITVAYELEGLGSHHFGSGSVEFDDRCELEPGFDVYQKISTIRVRSAKPLGSLLSSTIHPCSIRFWVTPLADAESVDTLPGGEWRRKHARAIGSLFDRNDSGWSSQGGGSGLEFGAVKGSGLGLMILGALCLIFTSAHGLRTMSILCVCMVAYAGAVDGTVVAIETARFDHDSPGRIAAAAIETAGTLMHPATAAERLLALAASDKSVTVRTLALRCLDRTSLLSALREMDDSEASLQKAARSDDPQLAGAARFILGRLEPPNLDPGRPGPYDSSEGAFEGSGH